MVPSLGNKKGRPKGGHASIGLNGGLHALECLMVDLCSDNRKTAMNAAACGATMALP